jgi:hypothetical protein
MNAITLELKTAQWTGSKESPLFRLLQGLETIAQPQRPANRPAQKLTVRSNDWPAGENEMPGGVIRPIPQRTVA